MKFTYNWLKDYLDLKLSAQDLADQLTMSGLEVKSVDKLGEEFVFEAEVTPNRPDCLSIIGIAREAAALTGGKVKLPKLTKLKIKKPKDLVKVKVENSDACARYVGLVIRDIKVSASPLWLKERIEKIGLRSVNNVVDITNFCLYEWGQPIHAFDLDKLNPDIAVRFAHSGEKITTIDGVERDLNKNILVIADSVRPAAIAGIMGGKDSEVGWTTKNILLEIAFFNPRLIRNSARALALASDSSYRFERTVDIGNILNAAARAAELILDLCGNGCNLAQVVDIGNKKVLLKTASLRPEYLERLLGSPIDKSAISKILIALGLNLKKTTKKSLEFIIPSFRPDIKIEEDLIEEVARIHGFAKIPDTLPTSRAQAVKTTSHHELKNLIRENFVRQGLSEVITYGLLSEKLLKSVKIDTSNLRRLENPISLDAEFLRPSITPLALAAVKHNFNHQNPNLKFFEIGDCFGQKESLSLCVALSGQDFCVVTPTVNYKLDSSVFRLKGVLENLFSNLGIENYSFKNIDSKFFTSGQGFGIYIEESQIGIMGSVHKNILTDLEIKTAEVFIAELEVLRLQKFVNLRKEFKAIEIYPSISRDISLSLKESVSFGEVVGLIRKLNIAGLIDIKLIDYYSGKHISRGFKGLTLSIKYQAKDHTLSEEEITPLHNQVLQALVSGLGVEQR